MSDDYKVKFDGVFGWGAKGDKAVPPKHNFPKEVKERADYYLEMVEDGMTFIGVMECIFGDKKPEGYDFGATKDWIPKSEEFNKWESFPSNLAQCEMAVYLIYGDREVGNE